MRLVLKSFLLIALFWFNTASGQTDPLKSIVSKLESTHKQIPVEKVHLHFDKPYYSVGDTIWFKAYLVNADQNEFSDLSKVLHVELINPENKIERSLRLPVELGSAAGELVLIDTLNEGNYRIRAYTQWMRNLGEDYFFEKNIAIGDALSNDLITKTSFTITKNGEKETVAADILYTTLDNKVVSGKPVSYTVEANKQTISIGKGITDEKGNIRISFVNDKPSEQLYGVINTEIKLDVTDKKTIRKLIPLPLKQMNVSVTFFPEGGSLVENIPSRVAFKVLNPDGLGADVSGYIADNENNRIVDFATEHAGMGVFSFVPLTGKTYRALIPNPDGTNRAIALPKASENGYVLNITQPDTATVKVKVMVSQNILKESPDVILVAQSNNNIWYTSKTKLKADALSTSIPKSRFPEGIVQFTLFAGDIPVAERLMFIDHTAEHLGIVANTNKTSYTAREKVKIDLGVNDNVAASLSLAVTDLTKVPADELAETTIFSSILLSFDLKGYIEKPNYYFTNKNAATQKHLDNLMLTQGWRKFDWKRILSDSVAAPAFEVEKGISIKGQMLVAGTKRPVVNGRIMLFAPNEGGLPLDTITDAQGRFSFDNVVFKDSTKLVIRARNEKDKSNVSIRLDQDLPPQIIESKNRPDEKANQDSLLVTYLKSSNAQFTEMAKFGMLRKTDIQLKEVKISTTKLYNGKEIVENSSNLNSMPGRYNYLFKAKQVDMFPTVGDALVGLVPGLQIPSVIKGEFPIRQLAYLARNQTGRLDFSGTPMAVYVDGVNKQNDLGPMSINPFDVATIEVLISGTNTAIYGPDAIGGVIVITTKKGNEKPEAGYPVPTGIVSFQSQGYTIAKQFYSPVYTPEKKPTMMDLRSTIYWNPDLLVSHDNRAVIEFFTADSPGTYQAVVEGMDVSGRLGRKVITFTVK